MRSVLFHSTRTSFQYVEKLFTIPLTGGLAQELPLPARRAGSLLP